MTLAVTLPTELPSAADLACIRLWRRCGTGDLIRRLNFARSTNQRRVNPPMIGAPLESSFQKP